MCWENSSLGLGNTGGFLGSTNNQDSPQEVITDIQVRGRCPTCCFPACLILLWNHLLLIWLPEYTVSWGQRLCYFSLISLDWCRMQHSRNSAKSRWWVLNNRNTCPTPRITETKMRVPGLTTSWQIEGGKGEAVTDFIFLGSQIIVDVTAAMKLKDAYSLKEKLLQN